MCNFFSLVSDPVNQRILYSDWKIRQAFLKGEIKNMESPDSHSSIAKYHGYTSKQEDKLNKYEYNPLTKKFVVDQINSEIDDSAEIEKYCKELNFVQIVPAVVVKPFTHPSKIKPPEKITKKHLALLKEWASIRASVRDFVRTSVRASGWDSVGAYIGSFFLFKNWKYIKHPKGAYPLDCLVKLWEQGLVPSNYGKVWYLHGGEKGEILWRGKKEAL